MVKKLKKVWAAFTSGEFFYLPVWTGLISAGFGLAAWGWSSPTAGWLALAALATSLGVTYATYQMLDSLIGERVRAQAVRWAQSADTEDEALLRFSKIESMGATAALGAWMYATNVDGVPMLDGGMIDVQGRAFGDTHDIFAMDTMSTDVGTGMGMDFADAYSSPIGMD